MSSFKFADRDVQVRHGAVAAPRERPEHLEHVNRACRWTSRSANVGAAAIRPGSLPGAPPSTHAAMVSISACFKLTSFEYLATVGSAAPTAASVSSSTSA